MSATSQNKEKFEDYEGFVAKFKPKKTTDDCYTPLNVYDAITDWVANEYNVNRETFCRPFYPGGDYEHFDYGNKIVVDNPPFSILANIIKFYIENKIKFFLFVPTLTSCRYGDYCSILITGVQIMYENGANINTSFATNLEPNQIRARTVSSLYKKVDEANRINIRKVKKHLPKYDYPLELVTTANIYSYAKYGIEFVIPRFESVRVPALDAQRSAGKQIFGSGWLVSKNVVAEREKAEREKAERWILSDRELTIIAKLSEQYWKTFL